MDEEESDEIVLRKFQVDVARVSERYPQYLLIIKDSGGAFFWKASDITWGLGAAIRYLAYYKHQEMKTQ